MTTDLRTKPDAATAMHAWEAFWRGERRQPLVAAVLPKPGVEVVDKPNPYLWGPDLDIDAFTTQAQRWAETHDFLGAALPFLYLEFAADQFATFLGADLTFPNPGEGGWPIHTVADCPLSEVHIEFSPSGRWWDLIARLAAALTDRCGDSLLLAGPTLSANLDVLVALRGAQTVLMDLIDAPEEMKRVLSEICTAQAQAVAALGDLLDYEHRGSINRHGMYSRGPINVLQCDFSCMISTDMFREFLVPCLEAEMATYAAVEYHLDGPGALHHLEALCALDRLDIVQWVPGAADEHRDWSDLYRRIDALGKGQIRGGRAEALERWAGELTTRRLFWNLGGADRRQAEAVLARYAEG
ncbi:MAG: hypothetical protein GX595_20560 [Lentisphaerae bacterium]|nr:hypothetical protein [Lentisphaerota bacterium]